MASEESVFVEGMVILLYGVEAEITLFDASDLLILRYKKVSAAPSK